ncbi:unnamed protein product [Lymnaea stagnalis]|uniref:Transmembrane protein n=1 Tax=Lymnaea stagnalis TaxID=6523 RepID=A0AAV2GZH4_LYMST
MYQFARNYGHYGWLLGAVGATVTTMYPHTFGLEYQKEQLTSHSHGKPAAVDSEVLYLAEEIKQDLNIKENAFVKHNLLDFVQTDRPDFTTKGFMSTKWGAVVGVPIFFSSQSFEKANENSKIFNLDLSTVEGQKIMETFRLSRAAKKFALAREINKSNSNKVYVDSAGLGLAITSFYVIADSLANLFSIRGAKVLSFLTMAPLFTVCYIKMNDKYNNYFEKNCDKKAARIDRETACGGIEYYTALITRKELLQNLGKDNVPEKKDIIFGEKWRKYDMTLSEKKTFLIRTIKEYYPDEEFVE